MSSVPYSIEKLLIMFTKYDIYIVNRKDEKNQRFIRGVGLTNEEACQEIRKIRKEHLYKGPFLDKDIPDNYLYEFHKEVCGKWCYIKLTVVDDLSLIKVISFHESEMIKYGPN